ncbi:MAG: gamma carbonic anhydrase family protein [Clostridioides sp.]|jgi:carbonic anhydrase/acetyltransferase-like protein (isoleucine patch superfamily)|nr:gamma carbonic anhydrase family protein [Clostridioides sp.]
MIRNFKKFSPEIDEEALYIDESAMIIGDVLIGKDCTVLFNAVIRGDVGKISIGEGTNVQDNVVIHGDGPTVIGKNVTIGHQATIHGATIGDNTLIGMGSILLDECVIGENSIVAAGSVVTGHKEFPAGVLIMGMPAKAVRQLSDDEIRSNEEAAQLYKDMAEEYRS